MARRGVREREARRLPGRACAPGFSRRSIKMLRTSILAFLVILSIFINFFMYVEGKILYVMHCYLLLNGQRVTAVR